MMAPLLDNYEPAMIRITELKLPLSALPVEERRAADAPTAAQHRAGIHTTPAKFRDAAIAGAVLRQARDEGGITAKLRELHGDIRLRTAKGHVE